MANGPRILQHSMQKISSPIILNSQPLVYTEEERRLNSRVHFVAP
ncbi:MAG TPA: hypothetical protein DEF41_05380 [Desulfovibrio sp.]|uniref:Uncharacterized protein n=1 Tax=Nitratidesulfovibrio vulgaris (strain ATCC 29579 / DSM 644 / CCUG 34227 / NCIMB 8303 / VKM B-1760 / Hildenborough) TaxID=882 RepID=Q72AJ8_NITV2|nr:hypothetical protein DVU_1994 [Nitratidesulfovibrio vulgaris str. Hildenborough]HBW15563.1 hypothetical protein [Desulfovibrio sp.]